MRLKVISASIAAAAALFAVGCHELPPSKPASRWTASEAHGAEIFAENCSRCHYPDKTWAKQGPGLQAITKVKAMPSGAPPTDERLTATILHGRGMMPPTTLDESELRDLLDYIHSL
jgi:mono/diheme cytochrome c family protein